MTTEERNILALCIVFFLTSVLWGVLIPVGEAPDEGAHVRYAEYIWDHAQLPDAAAIRRENLVEAWHPPLYHALIAMLIGATTFSDREMRWVRNPEYNQEPVIGKANALLNSEVRRQTPLRWLIAYHVLRLPNALFGTLLIWLVWKALRLLSFPETSTLTIVGIWAATPGATFMSAVIGNDMLAACLCAAFFYCFLKAEQADSFAAFIGASALLGLGILTKTTIMFLWGAMLAYVLICQKGNQRIRQFSVLFALPLVMTCWFILRSWELKPLIIDPERVQRSIGFLASVKSWGISAAKVLYAGFLSFVGAVGNSDIGLPGWYCGIFAGFMFIAAYAALRRVRQEGWLKIPRLFLPSILATLLVNALCVKWYRFSGEAIHGRYFYPFLFGWFGLALWGFGGRNTTNHKRSPVIFNITALVCIGLAVTLTAVPNEAWTTPAGQMVQWARFAHPVPYYVEIWRRMLGMATVAIFMLLLWMGMRNENKLLLPWKSIPILWRVLPMFAVNIAFLIFYVSPFFS